MRPTERLISIVSVATALFIGSTTLMPPAVYGSWWWTALWCAIGTGTAWSLVKTRLRHRPPLFFMHLSFLLILAGGGLTAFLSERGTLRLSPGETATVFVTEEGKESPLPAEMTLVSFTPEYYPGMSFPRDFRTHLAVKGAEDMEISMNRIGRMAGYRLYQTSSDDKGGTVLTVSHDPAGTAVTYSGYLLFILSGAWMLSRRRKWRKPVPAVMTASFLMLCTAEAGAAFPAIDRARADSLEGRQVIFNGRVVPFGTVSRELTLKLTGKEKVGELSATRFVASLILYPEEWSDAPFLYVKSRPLRKALGINGKHVSPRALYSDSATYRPVSIYRGGEGSLDKAVLQLDERVALLGRLIDGTLFTPLAEGDSNMRPYAEIKAELLWNRTDPPRIYFILILAASLLALCGVNTRIASWTAAGAGICVLAWQWYVTGHAPLADSPQILRFMATGIIVTGAVATRNDRFLTSAVLLTAGCVALVSWTGTRDPAMTPLMPVLDSPWLAIHVSIVMTAYALLAFTLPAAVTALLSRTRREELTATSLSALAAGTYLLAVGIFAGAMWANVSWGRYWAWDPKETWALVTLLLYALPMHRSTGMRDNPILFHTYLIFASLSIVMTYAGVNLLDSMHAYS